MFCHAYGTKIVLLLGGYDKASDPSAKRQRQEIDVARARLSKFVAAQKAAKARKKRRR